MDHTPSTGRLSRRRYAAFALLAFVPTLLVSLVLADVLWSWWQQRREMSGLRAGALERARQGPLIFEDSAGGLRLKRFLDLDRVDPISGRRVHLRTNALGQRGGPIAPKQPGERRVLVLGDSITLGLYVEEDETYCVALERLLSGVASPADGGVAAASEPAQPRVRVINAGMAGAALREELLILHETGLLTQPDVVLVGLFLNDALTSQVYPLPEGLAAYSAMARTIAQRQLELRIESDARREYERLSGQPFPAQSFAPDAWRRDPGAFEAEVARAALDWGGGFFAWAWREMRPDLEVLRELAVTHRFRLVVVLFPVAQQVEAAFLDDRPQRQFAILMDELGIVAVDLLPALRDVYRRERRSLFYDHCHLTPEGNRIAADSMVAALQRQLDPMVK